MKTTINKTASLLLTFLFLSVAIALNAQEKQSHQVRDIDAISGISLNGVVAVSAVQSDNNTVSIKAPENIINEFTTNVKNNVLHITAPANAKDYTINVTFQDIDLIEASGSTRFVGSGIQTEFLEIKAEGASDIYVGLEVSELKSKISGAANLTYTGKAKRHYLNISGASNLKALTLDTDYTRVTLAGASEAHLKAHNELTGSISGIGTVRYTGDPELIQVETSGTASLKKASSEEVASAAMDTTLLHVGSSKVMILSSKEIKERREEKRKKGFSGNWGGVEIGVNGWLNDNQNFDMPSGYGFLNLKYNRSIGVNLNLIEQSINLYKNRVGLVTGLGFTFNTYQFSRNISLLPAEKNVKALTDTIDFKRNRLKVTYLTLPLLLEAQAGKSSQFHISGGMIFGLRIGSHTRQVYEIDGATYRNRVYDDFNLNPFRAEVSARAGWNSINIFANYSLTSLFKSSKDPDLYPFTVGVRLTSW